MLLNGQMSGIFVLLRSKSYYSVVHTILNIQFVITIVNEIVSITKLTECGFRETNIWVSCHRYWIARGTEYCAGFNPLTSHLTSYAAVSSIPGDGKLRRFFKSLTNRIESPNARTYISCCYEHSLHSLQFVLYRHAGIVLNISAFRNGELNQVEFV